MPPTPPIPNEDDVQSLTPNQPTDGLVTGDGSQPVNPTDRPLNADGTTGHAAGEPQIEPGRPGQPINPDSGLESEPPEIDSQADKLARLETTSRAIESGIVRIEATLAQLKKVLAEIKANQVG